MLINRERSRMTWSRLILLAGLLLALGACGVRGDLDPPPDSAARNDSFILDKII